MVGAKYGSMCSHCTFTICNNLPADTHCLSPPRPPRHQDVRLTASGPIVSGQLPHLADQHRVLFQEPLVDLTWRRPQQPLVTLQLLAQLVVLKPGGIGISSGSGSISSGSISNSMSSGRPA